MHCPSCAKCAQDITRVRKIHCTQCFAQDSAYAELLNCCRFDDHISSAIIFNGDVRPNAALITTPMARVAMAFPASWCNSSVGSTLDNGATNMSISKCFFKIMSKFQFHCSGRECSWWIGQPINKSASRPSKYRSAGVHINDPFGLKITSLHFHSGCTMYAGNIFEQLSN